MAFLKKWKKTWALKSLTFEQLFNIIAEVISKQLDEIDQKDIKAEENLFIDYDADSVDIVAMLLHLEDVFKYAAQNSRIVVPIEKLDKIVSPEDILDIMYEVLVEIETKMDTFSAIKPDYDVLHKGRRME